ncbi:protein of unknown function [Streptomyces murinus]
MGCLEQSGGLSEKWARPLWVRLR